MSSKIGYRKDITVDQGDYNRMAKQINRLERAREKYGDNPTVAPILAEIMDGAPSGRTKRLPLGNTKRLLDQMDGELRPVKEKL